MGKYSGGGRVVIIGAGSDIGRGVAREFAASGARMVLLDVDELQAKIARDEALRIGAAQVHLVVAETGSPGAVEIAIGISELYWGGVDTVVAILRNRAVSELDRGGVPADSSPNMLENSQVSPTSLAAAAIRSLIESGGGCLVYIAVAERGLRRSTIRELILESLAQSISRSYLRHGIRAKAFNFYEDICGSLHPISASSMASRDFDDAPGVQRRGGGDDTALAHRLLVRDLGRVIKQFVTSQGDPAVCDGD